MAKARADVDLEHRGQMPLRIAVTMSLVFCRAKPSLPLLFCWCRGSYFVEGKHGGKRKTHTRLFTWHVCVTFVLAVSEVLRDL